MLLQAFDIEGREKPFEGQIPQLDDFRMRASGTVSSEKILRNPNISLYCLDPAQQNAVFVETPAEVNLSQAPFYYMAQFAHATRVILAPYQELHQLARQVPLEGRQLILIYSVGRSGSTLASAAFNQAAGVISLSEPDVFSQLIALRDWNGDNDREISALVKSCTHLLCKNPAAGKRHQKWAIKFRNFGIELGDLMHQHFPEAKCLFLYRNLDEWADSMVRAFGNVGDISPEMLSSWREFTTSVLRTAASHAVEDDGFSLAQMLGLNWLSPQERYLSLVEQGIPILPVRYEDMRRNTLPVMESIFSYCGVVPTDRRELDKVLKKDSQAGSFLARDLTREWQLKSRKQQIIHELHELLKTHPVITSPDFELPGTLLLERS